MISDDPMDVDTDDEASQDNNDRVEVNNGANDANVNAVNIAHGANVNAVNGANAGNVDNESEDEEDYNVRKRRFNFPYYPTGDDIENIERLPTEVISEMYDAMFGYVPEKITRDEMIEDIQQEYYEEEGD